MALSVSEKSVKESERDRPREEPYRELISHHLGEEVVVRYGKGKRRRREVAGKIAQTFKNIFTLEYEKDGHRLTEAFRYSDLRMEHFSIALKSGRMLISENG